MLGYIGVGLLMIAYIFLITSKSAWFIPLDIIATIILIIHAIMLKDIPFIIVNIFIAIMLLIKFFKKETI